MISKSLSTTPRKIIAQPGTPEHPRESRMMVMAPDNLKNDIPAAGLLLLGAPDTAASTKRSASFYGLHRGTIGGIVTLSRMGGCDIIGNRKTM
jgi:hypothetical protein